MKGGKLNISSGIDLLRRYSSFSDCFSYLNLYQFSLSLEKKQKKSCHKKMTNFPRNGKNMKKVVKNPQYE